MAWGVFHLKEVIFHINLEMYSRYTHICVYITAVRKSNEKYTHLWISVVRPRMMMKTSLKKTPNLNSQNHQLSVCELVNLKSTQLLSLQC